MAGQPNECTSRENDHNIDIMIGDVVRPMLMKHTPISAVRVVSIASATYVIDYRAPNSLPVA